MGGACFCNSDVNKRGLWQIVKSKGQINSVKFSFMPGANDKTLSIFAKYARSDKKLLSNFASAFKIQLIKKW